MNNNFKLSALAALGLIAGSMGSAEAACRAPSSSQMKGLFSQLDGSHQQMFNSMSCEGQNMAMKMANQKCKGQNDCKGMNSCKTKQNSCAGQGACAGTSAGPFKDKNKAVEVANKRMQSMEEGE